MGCCASDYVELKEINEPQVLLNVHRGLSTGDLLLFKSHGSIGCCARFCTVSRWDHVALVVSRTTDLGPRPGPKPTQKKPSAHVCSDDYCTCIASAEDIIELLEATAAGVHIYSLDERLAKTVRHHEYIAVRKLIVDPSYTSPKTLDKPALEQLIRRVRGRAYEDNPVAMATACCFSDYCCSNSADSEASEEALFCSELTARAAQELGVLSASHEPDFFLPEDFGMSRTFSCRRMSSRKSLMVDNCMPAGFSYGPPMLLQYPGSPYEECLLKLKKKLRAESKSDPLAPPPSEGIPRRHLSVGE